jgi:hypothetical protein
MDEITEGNDKDKEEGEKLYFESMKHLTTLNTGSILLLVAVLVAGIAGGLHLRRFRQIRCP